VTRSGRLALAAAGLVLASACSSSVEPDDATGTTTAGEAPASSAPVDTSPFCENVRALVELDAGADEPTPEAVVAQAGEMVTVLDEITINVPPDAPPEVEGLLDDFRAIAEAVGAAGGDLDAAYASIEAGQPELWARLSDPAAHDTAFRFFADRCGTPLP